MNSVYDLLFKTTVITSIMVAAIMSIKYIVADRLSIKWHYYIWFLLVIRLVMPISVSSSLSIDNLLGTVGQVSVENRQEMIPDMLDYAGMSYEGNQSIDKSTTIANKVPVEVRISDRNAQESEVMSSIIHPWSYWIWCGIWLLGMCIMGFMTLKHNMLLHNKIAQSRLATDDDIYDLLSCCKEQLGIKKDILIKWVDNIYSPAISGINRPVVLLPTCYEHNRPEGLQYILLHELLHYKRRDIVVLRLLVILQTIYWFNPFIWIGFHKMRQEMEMCCDEGVIRVMGHEHRRHYGKLIVELMEQNSHTSLVLPTLLGKNRAIKARIEKLMKHNRVTKYAISIGVLIGCVLMILFMTDRKEDKAIDNVGKSTDLANERTETTLPDTDDEVTSIGIIGGIDGPIQVFTSTENLEPTMLGDMEIESIEITRSGAHLKTITDEETIHRTIDKIDSLISIHSDMGVKKFYDTLDTMASSNQKSVTITMNYYSAHIQDNKRFKSYGVTVKAGNLTSVYTITDYNVFFNNLVNMVEEYNYELPEDVQELVDRYKLNVGFFIGEMTIRLPKTYDYDLGDNPVSLYWAYRNEFVKDIGMDFSDYLGKDIEISRYSLDDMHGVESYGLGNRPNLLSIMRYDGAIIGAYAENMMSSISCFSLNEKVFSEIVDEGFMTWAGQYIVETEESKALAKLKPQEVIDRYYQALSEKKLGEANKFMALQTLFSACLGRDKEYNFHNHFFDAIEVFNYVGSSKNNYSRGGENIYDVNLDIVWDDGGKDDEFKKFSEGEWIIKEQQLVSELPQMGHKVKKWIGFITNDLP